VARWSEIFVKRRRTEEGVTPSNESSQPELQVLMTGIALVSNPGGTRTVCGFPIGVRRRSLLLISPETVK
jgi:hypothetical protein